jgi:hypothetical protein
VLSKAIITVVVFGAVCASILWYGSNRWDLATKRLVGAIKASRAPGSVTRYDARELEGLPPPVQRYFRAVLKDGQPIITAACVEHAGTFNTGETVENWKPFTSHQWVVTRLPGFVWDGRVAMVQGIAVHVHDAYVNGEGILHPAIAGLYSLTNLRGSGEIAQGELMRFFAEAAWYPTALLPSQGICWEPVDDLSAKATLTDGPLTMALLFRFGDDGLIETIRADGRGRTVGNSIIMTPWEVTSSNYQERNGMRVPLSGEVAWLRRDVSPTGAGRSLRSAMNSPTARAARRPTWTVGI